MKTSPLAFFHSRCFRLGSAAAAVAVVVAALLCAHAGSQSGSTANAGQPVIQGGSRPAPSYGTGAPAPPQLRQAMKNPDYSAAGVIDGKAGFWVTGQGGSLPDHALYNDSTGALGVVNLRGPIATEGHPFFTPLGKNGRACVSCHQPANGMSISVATLEWRWAETKGRDPVFAAVDGSNCPNLPQAVASSHSLLLQHGLFRIFLPWPPKALDGSAMDPEFTIEVVRDPTGCNTSKEFGLNSAHPMVSVFRRPRIVANLKYVMAPFGMWSPKTGEVLPVDPATGQRLNLNLMTDNRFPTLEAQATDAALTHEQADAKPDAAILRRIVDFEMQIYAAQSLDARGGDLTGGSIKAGPQALIDGRPAVLGSHIGDFPELDGWMTSDAIGRPKWDRNTPPETFRAHRPGEEQETAAQKKFRDSVARGYEIFMQRDILIRNVSNYNTIGLGNPYKQPCANCHNAQRTGMDSSPGFMDLGTTNLPTADPLPWLPLFKLVCKPWATPHPFLGRVVYTHDPGRALITGKCVDIGSINMQQFRGLASRAPYFSNGSAKTIRDIVVYYNKRFTMGYTEQDIEDMTNFLSVL